MRIKRFVFKTGVKIFIFAVIMGMIAYILNLPTFTNSMAISQFENDNYSYMAWNGFLQLKNFFSSYYDSAICIFIGTIIYDIYTFIKHNKGENKHED